MIRKAKNQKKKYCYFCKNNSQEIDYKDVQTLRRFVSSFLKIGARRRTGLCSKHQRRTAKAIKQARIAGLIAFVPK
ncbi:MAG: 30S ribosomal protein S18 [Candidatus Magasanikbacteria bacterium]|nr:30S ribosomal protein S18 [Candidatus Magasanikbacteria bacterium]